MNLAFTKIIYDSRTQRTLLEDYVITDPNGNRIGIDTITPDDINKLIGEVDIINFFHEDGDVMSSIQTLAEQFHQLLIHNDNWVDVTVQPMKNDAGFSLKRVKSTAIRGEEQVLDLLAMFREVVVIPKTPLDSKVDKK